MENLKTLEKIAKIFQPQNIITSEEIDQVLKGIMEILASYKKGTDAINEETKAVVNSLLEQTIKYNQETISDFKSEAEKTHTERMKELQGFLSEVKTTLGDMEAMMSEVKDGKDADEERVIDEVINRIKIDPTVVTMSAEEVRDKLASLKEEDRLDKSAIKGLEKVLQQKDLDYAIATLQQQTSFLINRGGLKTVSHDATLSGDGTPENPLKVESTSGLTLETDGVANGSQTILNLVAGTNVTLTDNGTGTVTIDAAEDSGSGTVTSVSVVTANGISGSVATATTTPAITLDISALDAAKIADGSVSNTEFQYLNGVTSAIQTQLDGKVDENVAITGATKTKITYDSKGLVTAGADATTADIADSTNKRYVTDAQLTVIGNTSGANTGDVTVTDSTEIDFTLTGQNITASLKTGSIDEAKLDTSVNASLDLADTSVQPNSSPTLGTITTTGNIELGNASDTTLSRSSAGVLAVEGVVIPSISSTNTLTNKTIRNTVEPGTDDTYTGEDITGFNATATIAQWEAVYLSTTGWALTDADAASTAGSVMVGLAAAAGTSSNPLTVVTRGVIRNDGWTWSTVGSPLYLSTTAGALTETAPSGTDDVVRVVGYVMSDDCIFFCPSTNWIVHV